MIVTKTNDKELPHRNTLMNTLRETLSTAWNLKYKIPQTNIDRWLNNFSGEALLSDFANQDGAKDRERDLALFLLCNFVFYNESEVKYLTRLMFDKYLHNVICTFTNNVNVDDNFIKNILNKTQFVPLGYNSESSSYLLYHFRQENDLSMNNFKEKIETEYIVFIDDFTITGSQAKKRFCEFVEKYKDINNKHFYMLFMVTTSEAIKLLSEISNLTILHCIIMDDKSKVFSDASIVFDGYKDEYKIQAKKMCEYYGNKLIDEKDKEIGMKPLGFNGGSYIFGSYYNIPNNSLPIFWSERNDWHYLFKRYDKKYDDGISLRGKYV
jgi:hypothetical protein